MSHQPARLRFDRDGLILFAEYDGTADLIIPRLYTTSEDLRAGWRQESAERATCTCGQDEPAEYAESYGGGSHGPVRACRHCLAITDCESFDPRGEGYASGPHEGFPTWWDGPYG